MIKIDQALTHAFITAGFGLPIAHENINYNPSPGTPYAEIFLLNNDVTPLSLNDLNETDGVFRCILRFDVGAGAVSAKLKADEILQYFKIARNITYNGQLVKITRGSRQPGVAEDGWYKIIVDISYRAVLTR